MTEHRRNSASIGRTIGVIALSCASLIGISVSQSAARSADTAQGRGPVAAKPLVQTQALSPAERALAQRINALGASFNGDVGIAVKDIQSGYTASFDGSTFFPQQSVSKFWVALTAMDKADQGLLSLESPVTVRREDLTLFHQPIAAQVGPAGYTTTLDSLIHRAITQSDNTCNDFVLWKAGGPDAVRAFLKKSGISGIRFGPGERMLQSRIAGMEWKPSYVGQNFYAARNALPMAVRRAAFENYIRDPMDGATPLGTVDALTRLKKGELLSPYYTQKLLGIMSNTKTGAQRLKGGLAPGWKLAHKTGTGQVLGGEQAGYNDIGIVTGPDGRSYAVAVFIRRTSAPLGHRMETMQNVVRAVIDYSKGDHGVAQFAVQQQPPASKAKAPLSRQQAIAAAVNGLEEEGE
ncbi:class A beta-lactamase [Allosphingosinicella flava]|uniref:beta-lactamase n=1 Tax=Allosphingosinicella flava TaxID=2771430 RepID=A0A7T2GKQ4_9SPHN|nr:class A beta-lactamase [Sphingosinicella flava]QPQ55308.1 class A beta-lactamase [Sphingosinicella flava]